MASISLARLQIGLEKLNDAVRQPTLIELDHLIALAAAVFDCRVGVVCADGDERFAAPPAVGPGSDDPARRESRAETYETVRLTRASLPGWEAWVERQIPVGSDGAAGTLADEGAELWHIALEAFAAALATTIARSSRFSGPADLRDVVDLQVSEHDRSRALGRLHFAQRGVTVIGVHGPDGGVAELVRGLRRLSGNVQHTQLDRVRLVLMAGLVDVSSVNVPVGLRCAFSHVPDAAQLPIAWQTVRNAMRFAQPSSHDYAPYDESEATLLDADQVGVYAVLADALTAEAIADVVDVQQLEKLRADVGNEILVTLLAVASTDSLRQAARVLHLHHTSVSMRVARAERALGFAITEPFGRARLLLTLTLHRLFDSYRFF